MAGGQPYQPLLHIWLDGTRGANVEPELDRRRNLVDVLAARARRSDEVVADFVGANLHRGVRPDGDFALVDEHRLAQGLPARARFLLELDMAIHDVGSFVIEKAIAGWHYIQCPAYKARFGDNSGRWLVVITSEARRKHLMHQIRRAIGASAKSFLFTTQGETAQGNVLSCPIWWQAERDKPMTLFSG